MNPQNLEDAKNLAKEIKKVLVKNSKTIKKTQVSICPPYVYLGALSNIPTNNQFLGAQNAFYESMGSYTGEVSFSQLSDFKVSQVIIGHSERRKVGETDEDVNKKVRAVVGEGMTAIICIGEKVRDREGNYLDFIKNQITIAVRDLSKKSLDRIIIAYEPIYAIGAKDPMNPRDIHEMTIFIKKVLRELFGVLGDGVRILYGGAVDKDTAYGIIKDGNVDGLLVGRESLKPANFIEIVKNVEKA